MAKRSGPIGLLGWSQGQEYDLIATADGSGHVYCHSHGYGAYMPQVVVP
jgi:hypothetical protein